MKNFVACIYFLTTLICTSQNLNKKSINAQIGYGISVPYESEDDIADNGFFLQGEYVLPLKSWLEVKPYAGLIITNSNGKDLNNKPTDEKAETKAFLIGGKMKLRAPIKWVAPYLEFGIGTSIGQFETLTSTIDIEKSGLIYHIPLAFGLELGKQNNFDLGFSYYFQPTVEQFAGAFAFGISFNINNND